MVRPKFFDQEKESQELVLNALASTNLPLRMEDIFISVKVINTNLTTDVIQHSIISLLDEGKAKVTPDLKIIAAEDIVK
jgi:hypothetical protein